MKYFRYIVILVSIRTKLALKLDPTVSIEEAIDNISKKFIQRCTSDKRSNDHDSNFKFPKDFVYRFTSHGNKTIENVTDLIQVNGQGELHPYAENLFLRGQKTETFVRSISSNFTHGKPNGLKDKALFIKFTHFFKDPQ